MYRLALPLASFTVCCALGACASPAPEPASAAPNPWTLKMYMTDPWAPEPGPSFATGAPIPPAAYDPYVAPATLKANASRTNEPIAEPTSRSLVSGLQSGAVIAIAVTDDGRTVVTADTARSVRLWPTLDGKREPVVVHMRAPSALAIGRTGDELAIAGLDAAGQLEILRANASGASLRRLAIETAPLLAIHAIARGFVGLTDDRAVVTFGFDGSVTGRVVAEPGTHVVSLAVRADRVLALVEKDGKVRGQWVEHAETGPTWGATTVALPIVADEVVLSPDGKRVAGTGRGKNRMVIVELERGRVVNKLREERGFGALHAVGFVSDRVIGWTDHASTTGWLGGGNGNGDADDQDGCGTSDLAVVGGGRIVGPSAAGLEVCTPNAASEFVGYRMSGPSMVRRVGERYLATDGSSIVELDRHFRMTKVVELPAPPSPGQRWNWVQLLDDTHVAATSYLRDGYGIYLVDLETTAATLVVQGAYSINYEPASGLFQYQVGSDTKLQRYDVKTHTFGKPVTVPRSPAGVVVQLLDPTRANGNVVAMIANEDQKVGHLSLVRSIDPERVEPIEVSKKRDFKLDDEFWIESGDLTSLVQRELTHMTEQPSPDRAYVAELRDQRIILRDAAGRERWAVFSNGASTLAWTPAGELVAYGTGLARLDLSSGAMLDRQCGWRFGKWDAPVETFPAPNVCDAP